MNYVASAALHSRMIPALDAATQHNFQRNISALMLRTT